MVNYNTHAASAFYETFRPKEWDKIYIKKNALKKNIIYNYSNPDLKNVVFLLFAKLIGYKIILDIIEESRYSSKFVRFLSKIRIKSSIFL